MCENELIKQSFYVASLREKLDGTDLKNINIILKEFEDAELYLECAGIHKALKFIENYNTEEELEIEYKTHLDKLKEIIKENKDEK